MRAQAGPGRPQSGRARVLTSALCGLAAALVVVWFVPWQLTVLTGWDVAALVVLTGVWTSVWSFDPDETERFARREDDTRAGAELMLLGAAVASLAGVGLAFLKANEGDALYQPLLTAAGVLTIATSWLLVHTVFTLRYAHLYYTDPVGGIDFKAPRERPDYRDFAYTAFIVGMTLQVSDTDVTQRAVRRAVLRHAMLSFLFGAVILATAVNVIASLLNR